MRHALVIALLVGSFITGLTLGVGAQNPPTGQATPTVQAQPGVVQIVPSRFGGGVVPDEKLVARFDADRDGRLSPDERTAARAYLAATPEIRQRLGDAPRGGGEPGAPGLRLSPSDIKTYPRTPLYDGGTLRTIFIAFDDPDWEGAMVDFHRTDVLVPATMTVDGKVYRDVGVGFHGNNSFTAVPNGRKRSLKLSLDFVKKDQQLEGYRKLLLLNANQDPTFLRSVLYLDAARAYIPAPKANFVRVVINGESWGVYANQQAFDDVFVKEAFGAAGGTRWKSPNNSAGGGLAYLGEDVEPYRRWYDMKGKDNPRAWSDLIRLCRVLGTEPPDRLADALAPLLDVDGALWFLALDNALINNDGYWNDGSDFSLYQDARGRFHPIPYDVNEGFRASGSARGGRGIALDPFATVADANKALLHRLLEVPAFRAQYLAHIREIVDRQLDWAVLGRRIERYQALIAADVAADTKKLTTTEAFTTGIYGDPGVEPGPGTLKGFADQRRAFLLSHPEVSSAKRDK